MYRATTCLWDDADKTNTKMNPVPAIPSANELATVPSRLVFKMYKCVTRLETLT